MPTILVSEDNYKVIADEEIFSFRYSGQRWIDGSRILIVDEDIVAEIAHERHPSETDDDTITRIIRNIRGLKPN